MNGSFEAPNEPAGSSQCSALRAFSRLGFGDPIKPAHRVVWFWCVPRRCGGHARSRPAKNTARSPKSQTGVDVNLSCAISHGLLMRRSEPTACVGSSENYKAPHRFEPSTPYLILCIVQPARHHPPPQAIVRWISRLVLPPQALAKTVATEVHRHAARRSLVAVRRKPTTAALHSTTMQ